MISTSIGGLTEVYRSMKCTQQFVRTELNHGIHMICSYKQAISALPCVSYSEYASAVMKICLKFNPVLTPRWLLRMDIYLCLPRLTNSLQNQKKHMRI